MSQTERALEADDDLVDDFDERVGGWLDAVENDLEADELFADELDASDRDSDEADLDTVDVDTVDLDTVDVETTEVAATPVEQTDVEQIDVETDGSDVAVAHSVPPDVLEELRRADIDGPTVAFAPQDDHSAGIRRPRRAPDYDPAPFPIPLAVPRVLGRKPRVRRVSRVVRHVDPWTVFKVGIVANLVLYVIMLTAGVLLWNVSYATGTVDNVERFFESFGWSSFEFNGGELYHAAWIGGLFAVIGLTGFWVLLATLFNLITDLVGGIRLTVLEEEVVESRPSPMRRFVVRRPEPEVPAVTYDHIGPVIREAVVDDSGSIPR